MYKYMLLGGKNETNLTTAKIHVYPGIMSSAIAEMTGNKYDFKGKMELLDHNVYFYFNGVEHFENLLCVFKRPLLSDDFYIQPGIMLGITETSDPAATQLIISRIEISESMAKDLLGSKRVFLEQRQLLKSNFI